MTESPFKRLVTQAQLEDRIATITTNGVVGPTGPKGDTGPANSLTIGTVTKIAPGGTPTATITGTAPSQVLNLGVVTGDTGAAGSSGAAGVSSINTRTGDVTLAKSDVGLTNVDNTADTAKPVSSAQQTALNLKLDTSTATASQVYAKDSTGAVVGIAYDTNATASAVARRDTNGQLAVPATPTATTHAASKTYVDTATSARLATSIAANSQVYAKDSTGTSVGVGYAQAATANALIQRNSDGTAVAADPTASTHLATKNYTDTQLSSKAPLASPAFTGTPTAPTAAAGTNTTQIATTAHVAGNYAPATRTLTAGTGLQGGGTLAADRTFALSTATQTSLAKADAAVASDGNILRVLKITSSAYSALASKDANTLYVVVG